MTAKQCFLIAEAGVNHNGNVETALELVRVAADAGADAVKFQTFNTDDLVTPGTEPAKYQRSRSGSTDQYSMLRALQLEPVDFQRIRSRCNELNIEFMSTPFDIASALSLVELGMQRIKVPSGELTNLRLIRALARFGLPLIVSTGMANLQEVEAAVEAVRAGYSDGNTEKPLAELLTLLQCTSAYPAAPHNANLRAMQTMAQHFGVPVGYSDHTLGDEVALAAVALGASTLEKHFTLNRSAVGPDHGASLEPDELRNMVSRIRKVSIALGDGEKRPSEGEAEIARVARRSIMLARTMVAGKTFAPEDLLLRRPGTGISAAQFDNIVGRVATRNLPAGHLLEWTDVI